MFADNTFTARFWRALLKAHTERGLLLWGPSAALLALFLCAMAFDAPVSRALESWPDHERAVFRFITDIGKSDWILYPSLLGALIGLGALRAPLTYSWRWASTALAGLSAFIFIGVGFPGLVSAILKRVIGRARPLHLEEHGTLHFEPFSIIDWTMQSFPSGHSTTAMALAMVVVTLTAGRWRIAIFAVAVAIGLSRIVLGQHYLSDVLTGFAWGILGAVMVRDYFLTRRWGLGLTASGRPRFRLLSGFGPLWRRLRRGQVPPLLK